MLSRARSGLRRLWQNASGSFALKISLLSPLLMGAAAGLADYTQFQSHKAALQGAVDSAALAAAREASLKGWDEEIAKSVAEAVFSANVGIDSVEESDMHALNISVDQKERKVTVTGVQDHYPYFASFAYPSPQISASASAASAGKRNVCVIGLDKTRADTISAQDFADLNASDCAVYSNSTSSSGFSAYKESSLTMEFACSVGGAIGEPRHFAMSRPVTDCPSVADPLADRPPPSFSGVCDEQDLFVHGSSTVVTISPGVYCGGIWIKSGAKVLLEPGTYIIKDGPLLLDANATMEGTNVGFYFTGDDARFRLFGGSHVALTAPKSGPMAGLLFFQDRAADEQEFLLKSNTASMPLGTIYLKNGNFVIDTNSKVADASAYTVIVARSVVLKRKPKVVINTDYDATDVPVPDGLGPLRGDIRLLN